MKCLAFAVALAILVAPAVTAAKDAGPATKPAVKAVPKKVEPKPAPKPAPAEKKAATTKKVEAPKPAVKKLPKKTPKAAVPASQPAQADAKAPLKGEIKTEGKVELPDKGEVKLKNVGDDFDMWGAIKDIWTNFKEGKVWDGIALILMVLTFAFFKLKKDLPVKYAVWIATGLAVSTNIVSAIIGGVEWGPVLTSGIFQGAAAGGLWSAFGKHVFRSKEEKSKRAAAREMAEGKSVSGEVGE